MMQKSALAFAFCLSAGLVAAACGSPPAPPVPPVPLPEPRASASTSAPEAPEAAEKAASAAEGKDAGASVKDGGSSGDASSGDAGWAAPSDAGTLRTGPVVDDTDAVGRAFRPANAALDKAYAEFVKKAQVAPSHTGAWTRSAPSVVKGNAKVGWDVTFSSFPPAGFSHEAIVHVGPKGDATVKKAVASFSPD